MPPPPPPPPPLLFLLFFSLVLSRPPLSASRPAPQGNDDNNRKDRVGLPSSHHPSDTWLSFQRFLDVERGRRVSGMAELKRYLNRFGYLPGPTPNFTDAFDARLESAVALYQSKLGLPVTGRLDSATLSLMMSPRCGLGDAVEPTGEHATRRFAYFPGQPRWVRSRPMTLTYAISATASIDYIPRENVMAAVRQAFQRWSQVIPVSFTEASEYEAADVKLGFYTGDHGDGEPFDGVLGVLAHAFSPESGRLHLDAAERWAVDFDVEKSKVAVDLESVATHEIGHVLGLAHSSLREAVMYPSLNPRTKKVELTVDDVEGVQALYGSNPNFNFSSLSESDTSSSASPRRGGYTSLARESCIGILLVVVHMTWITFLQSMRHR